MRPLNFPRWCRIGAIITLVLLPVKGLADPSHGIAMYGDPALPPDFVSLPYANPQAPKGGRVVTGNTGGYDSLNPFILKGTAPWQLRFLAAESLMGRNWDEPFTLYGLLAESVETGPEREWVEFTLRPEARFSDGSPVTVEDVIWSYDVLGTEGHPRYHGFWSRVERIEQTGERKVRLTFETPDRELAMLAGMRPILKKTQWAGKDFSQSTLEDVPITTAPYVIADFEPGRHVTLHRDPDYWGRDLPFRRGTHNLDEIRIEFFGDGDVLFEAFKAGDLSYIREFNAEAWANRYDFRRVREGDIVKSEIPHQKPSGMTGLVMNTRRAPFDDIRVRDALLHAFNFEFVNDTLTGGRQPRITSYFSNSILAMRPGPAEGRVAELLTPYAEALPPGTLEGYTLPQSDGTSRNRGNLRKALRLLADAGWTVQEGRLANEAGTPMRFEILLRQADQQTQAIADIYSQALERLGIDVRQTTVDNAQYTRRINAFDFDMTDFRRSLSLSPGNEQRLYWGSEAATQEGSRNLMGVRSKAVDEVIDALLASESREDFLSAARALDRVLTAGRYVIPIWTYAVGRIAHVKELKYPDTVPIYGDGAEWMPATWWYEETEE
ncbi:peptide/nickel transport system substrate-binding protein [Salinihabitans flavidus]|uniref:Peptide/nickel transport system substrate-binding protein n=1 Tax=Salinihabitans flavidus TaxID=569882 RepID=A0A1H8NH57_9RHOB|nr:extracellular solute-binding protein [Salinihabitans flavidus]SEO28778.1 peptide/nickel transport system substrate-binding protein [Salinihabitans flavidus]